MNIYITKENEKRLRELNAWTMSGLINYLLNGWFALPEHTVQALKDKVEAPAFEKFPTQMLEPLPLEEAVRQTPVPTAKIIEANGLCEHFAGKGFCKVRKCKNSMFNPKNK